MHTQVHLDKLEVLPDHIDEIVDIDMSLLKFDGSNPNVYTPKKKKALQNLIKRFGYLNPITIDYEGNIINGEHRVMAYKQLGHDSIPALIIDTAKTSVDKKLLRQLLNKFHGEHEVEKDYEEIQEIREDEVGALLLEECLDITDETMDELAKALDRPNEENAMLEQEAKERIHRKIVLYFTKHEFPEYRERFDRFKDIYKVTDDSEVVKKLMEAVETSI